MSRVLSTSVALLVLAPAVAAQQSAGGDWQLLHALQAPGGGGPSSFSTAGDLDADGYPDFLVGAPAESVGSLAEAGVVRAYSGTDGSVLLELPGTVAQEHRGHSVSGGMDLDGDGIPDFAVTREDMSGSLATARVDTHSGADGTILWSRSWTAFPAIDPQTRLLPDLDGDGRPEVVVMLPWWYGPSVSGNVGIGVVLSGVDGATLWVRRGEDHLDNLSAVCALDDLDGDGVPEVLFGARPMASTGTGTGGRAWLCSGADGALLARFYPDAGGEDFGWGLARIWDVDGDGKRDFAIGAPGARIGTEENTGSVRVYSSADGAILARIDGHVPGERFGTSILVPGDLDGDGHPDLVVGAPHWGPLLSNPHGPGTVYVVSGTDGFPVWGLRGSGEEQMGSWLEEAGDVDLDGRPDLLVGALEATEQVRVLGDFQAFLQAPVRELSASQTVSVDLQMGFPASEAGRNYAVLLSLRGPAVTTLAGLRVPLGADSLLVACATGSAPPALTGAYGTLDANGNATASLLGGDPALAALVGRTLLVAAISYDTGPLAGRYVSVARPMVIVP
jgi:hypothetical protein